MSLRSHILKAALAAWLASAPVSAQAQVYLELDAYCTYYGEQISEDIYSFESDAQAQEAVRRILDHTGLNQNFNIAAANVPNAAAAIRGEQRLILYSQDFMRRVRDTTQTDWAAISIMAHEVGHHLQGHTIRAGGSRPPTELEADRYSGFVLYRMGATLDEAQAAMRSLGSDAGSATHPPKSARIAAITNGWNAARELAQNPPDTGAPSPQRQPQSPSGPVGGTVPPPTNPSPSIVYVARVVFFGDPHAYFVTSTDDLVGVQPNGTPTLVGRKIPPTLPGFAWMYSTPAFTYGVAPDGRVVTRNAFGQFVHIGNVTAPN